MKPPEFWEVLLQKAAEDEYTVDKLIDLPDSPDDVIGFHLQQATEKLLKALLSYLRIEYRYGHNLGELIHLLEKAGHRIPAELDDLRELTPFATVRRYDFIPEEGESPLDRKTARKMVAFLRKWVEAEIHTS